jgi:hypothetical protein
MFPPCLSTVCFHTQKINGKSLGIHYTKLHIPIIRGQGSRLSVILVGTTSELGLSNKPNENFHLTQGHTKASLIAPK